MKLALRQKICASLEPWVYQLGSLKLTHVLPENSIVATESLALYWLLYPQEFLFYLICFWCKYLFVLNISSSSFVIYCLTFKNRWLLLICFICYIFQLYILFSWLGILTIVTLDLRPTVGNHCKQCLYIFIAITYKHCLIPTVGNHCKQCLYFFIAITYHA